jgi:hypothetical protein
MLIQPEFYACFVPDAFDGQHPDIGHTKNLFLGLGDKFIQNTVDAAV